MKKFLALFLALVLVLGLCACGGSGKKPEGLQAGYAKQTIMPNGSVGLGGYSNASQRQSTGYLDYVYLSCIAFSEGDDTALLMTVDMCGLSTSKCNLLRETVSKATGIPETHITISSSHSHAAPSVGDNELYDMMFFKTAVAVAEAAIADLSPATLYAANVEIEGMNFIRHYIQADGSYSSANLGNFVNEEGVKHAREADNELVLLRAERSAEDKKDILLANWAAHPCYDASSDSTLITADYIGAARSYLEDLANVHFSFIQGGGGDAVTNSLIPGLRHKMERIEYGETLAQHIIDAIPTMEKVEGSGIQATQYDLEFACNHFGADKLQDAQRVMEFYNTNRDHAKKLAKELGFYSINHAKGVVNASKNPEKETMPLYALRIGGVGFAAVPAEVFSESSTYIKDNSPYTYTMFCSLTNGGYSYAPISAAFDYPSYEGFVSKFGKGIAEAYSEQLVTMLKDIQP